MVELYDYDGLFHFASLTMEQQEQIEAILRVASFQATLTSTLMEVSYAGRDTDRRIVQMLCDVAQIVRNAQGEVVCSFSSDNSANDSNVLDTEYEFYSIRDGKLRRQRGRVVRDKAQEIC